VIASGDSRGARVRGGYARRREGAQFGLDALEGESGVGSPEEVVRLCLDGKVVVSRDQ
jgi:hypothetical protein